MEAATPQASLRPGAVLAARDQRCRWQPGDRLEQVFEEQCDRWRRDEPAHLAVDNGTVRLSYLDLDARANRLARHLQAGGVAAGDRVGLVLDDPVRSYTAILAVLKLGAAYVPMDPAFPADRVAYIVEDAQVRWVLSLRHLPEPVGSVSVPVVCLDDHDDEVARRDGARLSETERGPLDDELAYVIYTSGSTGRPKGVAVEHASICNFVRVAGEVYGYRQDDRVYQGMTTAFDFSVEEMWVPWVAGATLVPKPGGTSLLGVELGDYLVQHRVSALCCVPTLLATLDTELPDLRFLLVSGEACQKDLVTRWHRPGLRFLNVYGPTEATVTATWDVVHPDKPVTLGVPLPTYAAVILHPEEARALPPGEYGEIGIAGIGLAREYVNRPDQTAAAFIPDFLGIDHNPSSRIYRTGDLGRFTADGLVEYAGRIDTQVKIRGYRIELTEIESVVLEIPGIAQAVVDVHERPDGTSKELVAYYTLRPGAAEVTDRTVHEQLRLHLPAYMVPAYYERLDTIPMLPSDKADRKRLPPPTRRLSLGESTEHSDPRTDTERALAQALGEVLGMEDVSAAAHFFDDLGANSLLLAQFSARVRKATDLPPLAMQDLYQHPTVRQLAVTLQEDRPSADTDVWAPSPPAAPRQVGAAQVALCGLMQVLAFLGYSYLMLLLMLTGYRWAVGGEGVLAVWARSVAFGTVTFVVLSAVPILLKWVVVGRWRQTEIPVWSPAYLRFWVVRSLVNTNPLRLFAGTPIYVLYLRALGARIGPGVSIFSTTVPVCTDLLTIGSGTAIRKDTRFACYRAYDGRIQTGPVTLGSDVLVGEMSVLDIGTSMGDGAQLGHTSSLQTGQAVPAGSRWHGSPARPTDTDYRVVPETECGRRRRVTYSVFVLLNRLVLVAPVGIGLLALVLPAYLDVGHLDHDSGHFYRDAAVLALVLYVGGLVIGLLAVVVVPRVLDRLLVTGRVYPLYGVHYAVHRMITRLTNLTVFLTLTGDSSLIVHYLRLIGYRQPDLVQTGSNFGVALKHETPFAVTVGSGTMVSDGLSIVDADYSSTSFRVAPVEIGPRNFFGNAIAYPAGGRTGDNVLFGTKTMVPLDGPLREDTGLLGSPPFEIPRSVERDAAFDDHRDRATFRSRLRHKNVHNGVTVALFMASRWFLVFCGLLFASFAAARFESGGAAVLLAAVLGFAVLTTSLVVLWEWAALGFRRLVPRFCSIYDRPFWQHERYWKFLGSPPPALNGTPFRPLMWRALGVRMGRRVFDDGLSVPEKTIVSVGDGCTFNAGSIIQCHSMEDGAFKLDGVRVGDGVTLGVGAFVHYGVVVGDGAVVEADSFLMKGSEVPARGRYGGNPAREVQASTGAHQAGGGAHGSVRPRLGPVPTQP
ncbi:Pls/PosA family non-ribosomal peptide synthetase [Ornithinimicrobium sediminis]|uniref:Pls/PosA family non-ribosomal peptide synthetase n=1 Tax=Ornithinimicrobium sediminis TaxID=2904603 RepID=UPI001E31C2F9|nr:Pls/PosA family non-ribosomal peptide synthetase [Ornithinimicrobium sediminis]MCE0488164.1 amino acid adenylation domain-containing protein [Ornithinimicrobium sediminis]